MEKEFLELVELSNESHADEIMDEFALDLDPLKTDITSREEALKEIRDRLIDHLKAAEKRGFLDHDMSI